MKGIINRINVTGLLLMAVVLALPALAAAQGAPGVDDQGRPQLEIIYYQWIHNDIIRNIEEIRRAKDPAERRDLVEDIEEIIYEKIEFPLQYKQAEATDEFDLNRIGVTSDVVEGKEASPVAPEIAEAYALLGIAKGFEGYGVAAADLFDKAKNVYANVMNMTVSLDHNDDNRTLAAWISASRGYWGNSTATRVKFYGKRVNQEVVDQLNSDNVAITVARKSPGYTEYVAKRDFVRGMKRYLQTDDTLKERKRNYFEIYLPPGDYYLQSELSGQIAVEFKVSRNPNQNNFIVETLASGVSVYPIPDIRVFEEEMRKLRMQGSQQDDLLAPAGEEGLPSDSGLLDEEPPPLADDEPPLE